jgi:NADH-quinone oxidoreductase subunit G
MSKPETQYVTVEVDGKAYSLPTDKPLLYALLDAGFDVPYFCSHKWLEPLGACRMCMVKMEEGGRMYPKLQIACAMYAKEGMKVWLDHPEVLLARKEQLEFHLLNHPLECPVCDKGGECMLQDLTFAHGWDAGRFIEQKRIRPDKAMNDYIRLNYKRCIHCKRCINFTNDIDQTHLLKFVTRGADTWIESYPEREAAPRFSGNVIDMCPVGALTARSYRFMGRPWEQQLVPSIGSLDSVGANIWLNGRLGEVARIVPRDNEDVENGLIDDVTRFSWECIDDPDRLRKSLVNGEKTNFAGGCKAAGARLQALLGEHGPDSVGIVAGSNLNTEEYLALRKLALEVLDTKYFHFGEDLCGGAAPDAALLSALSAEAGSIAQILHAGTVLTIGTDLFDEAPALGLWLDVNARRGKQKLLNLRSHGSKADSGALLRTYPAGDLLRWVRALTNAVNGSGETVGELAEAAAALQTAGDDCAILFGNEVWTAAAPGEIIRALVALRNAVAAANPDKPVWLNPVYPGTNTAGALLVNHAGAFASSGLPGGKTAVGSLKAVLEAAAGGKLKALLVVDSDVLNTYPDRRLAQQALSAAKVIYCGPFAVPTAGQADIVIPLGTWAHREGTVVSLEWRVQKRLPGHVDSVMPSVLDLANSLANAVAERFIAADPGELFLQLGEQIGGWPLASFQNFPGKGVRFTPQAGGARTATPETALPAAGAAPQDGALRLIAKRFLYNDRQEIRHSPVFHQVWKPFCAFLNPEDAARLGLQAGDTVAAGSLELPVKLEVWVRPGSVVVNDYCHAQPANGLFGTAALTLKRLDRPVSAGMHAPASDGRNAAATGVAGGGE